MAANKNAKSQLFTVRVPHEVVSDMETLKRDGESTAGFIVAAMQGEVIRRQTDGATENPLLSSLDALEQVEAIGVAASEEINRLVSVAREELQRRKAKPETPES
ncbi:MULTISPECIES: YlcI/YnfO family protein [unclassified Serratia (in: enterobacteria)]|uniref:YlcI/YnfO family protein n=1 Tax=unclassified Serratia (in: enterobacteria) TaxID=2647522 RepID=UPI00046AB2EB|nr:MULTISPECIES: YlcI/YnfO family protein [unclassified Serratia (in: enterobacteria)]